MKTQRTVYHLIIDKSGSMSDCIDATINGFNDQLNKIRSLELEYPEQEILIGLTTFNDEVENHFVLQNLSVLTTFSRKNYRPNGSTALFDAIGQTCLMLEERNRLDQKIPTTHVIVILTDGHENSSRNFNLGQIRSLIERLEKTEAWTFSFIGATLDAVEVAVSMSIKSQNSFAFEKHSMKSEVWDKLSNSMSSYAKKKSLGERFDDLFSRDKHL